MENRQDQEIAEAICRTRGIPRDKWTTVGITGDSPKDVAYFLGQLGALSSDLPGASERVSKVTALIELAVK